MVTISILREAGYPVGLLKDENAISLAEKNIQSAYFPSDETFETTEAKELLYALVFSLLLKRRTIATRFGSVQKISQYTINADNEQIMSEIRGYCRQPLEKYLEDKDFEPEDILEIYNKMFLI